MSYRAQQRVRDLDDPRAPGMVADCRAGASYAEVGADWGLSEARVKDILQVHMPEDERRALRQARRAAEKAEAAIRRDEERRARNLTLLLERMATAQRCRVCPAWNLRGQRFLTCSTECTKVWVVGRYQIDDGERERHRTAQARTILADPERYPASRAEWARRVLSDDPPPPNRRWRVANSAATRAARAAS